MNPLDMAVKDQDLMSAAKPQIPLSSDEKRVLGFFPGATEVDWEDWRWQIRNRFRTLEMIGKYMKLTPQEEHGVIGAGDKLPMSIPPYFLALVDPKNPECPVRLQSVPQDYEFETADEELTDPCGEDKNSPVHGLVHRYPDRVLFLVNEMC